MKPPPRPLIPGVLPDAAYVKKLELHCAVMCTTFIPIVESIPATFCYGPGHEFESATAKWESFYEALATSPAPGDRCMRSFIIALVGPPPASGARSVHSRIRRSHAQQWTEHDPHAAFLALAGAGNRQYSVLHRHRAAHDPAFSQ